MDDGYSVNPRPIGAKLFAPEKTINGTINRIHVEIKGANSCVTYFHDDEITKITLDEDMAGRISRGFFAVFLERELPKFGVYSGSHNFKNNRHLPANIPSRWEVVYMPTVKGSSLLLQSREFSKRNLAELGFLPDQIGTINPWLQRERKGGLIVVAGGAGAGKTITIDALAAELEKNYRGGAVVAEVFDVMEIDSETRILIDRNDFRANGADQSGDSEKWIGNLFSALNLLTAHVLIYHDLRTAQELDALIKIAQSGTIVLAEFHADNAEKTLERLIHLAKSSDLLASALKLIIAQTIVERKEKGQEMLAEVLPISYLSETHLRRTANAPKLVQLIKDKENFKDFAAVFSEKESAGSEFDDAEKQNVLRHSKPPGKSLAEAE